MRRLLLLALREALTHPTALIFLAASLALAAAIAWLPGLDSWSGRAVWMLALGICSYAGVVFVLRNTRPAVSAPELKKLIAIRRAIASRLREMSRAGGGDQRTELTEALEDAIRQLDSQIIPAMTELISRQQRLVSHLAHYQDGALPSPDPEILARLERIRSRQREAMDECIRQASNADATLVALLQEGDDSSLAASARAWAQDLLALHDALTEVLAGGDEAVQSTELPPNVLVITHPPPQPSADLVRPVPLVAESALVGPVEEALRRLNNPAALSTCELVQLLPNTIQRAQADGGMSGLTVATPLERAQVLREVLVLAIDRLRPVGVTSSGTTETIQYHILRDEYVLSRPTSYIMTNLSISESTFHRSRRSAILAIARDLGHQEAHVGQQEARLEN
jgi:hypothetical protein